MPNVSPILYESNETAFVSNGLGRLRDCTSCKVTEERNGIFECDFEYPVDGANFDLIQCGRIIGVTHDETGDVEPFDIVSYSKPISGVVSFHAVHISYRQRGIVARGTNVNSLADAFAVLHNSAQPSNPFTYEADFTSTAYASSFDGTPRSVRQFLGGIEGSILDAYGGEFEWDRFRVILHQSRGQVRDFVIRYGVNLLDYKDDTDYSETYTSCVPYWRGNDNGQDITVTGSRVDLGGSAYNGQNICAALDLSDKFENAPTTAELETLALNLMRSKQTNLPAQNISVDFVRLQDMGYEGLDTLLQCNLCDSIKVEFPRYGMSGTYKIVKTVWDVLADKYDSMELGQLSTTLAEALGIQSQTDTLQSIDDLTVNDLNVTGGAAIAGALTVGGVDIGSKVADIDSRFSYQEIGTTSYTSSTSWVKSGNFTIPATGLYRVRAAYANAAVLGLAYSLSTYNSIAQAVIAVENTTGASADAVVFLYANTTYSFWTKCSSSGRQNTVIVYRLLDLY